MNISFLFFSFGKLHSIKSNSSCIYVNYVLYRFHLSACKMTNMGGRGWGERDYRWYMFVSTTPCDLKPAWNILQTSPTSLAIPTPLCAHIFMGGLGHFWSHQVLWVRESNALIQKRTSTPIIKQYCICTWFQFAGNFCWKGGDWPISLPLSYFSNPIPLCGQWCSPMFPPCNYHKEEFILI